MQVAYHEISGHTFYVSLPVRCLVCHKYVMCIWMCGSPLNAWPDILTWRPVEHGWQNEKKWFTSISKSTRHSIITRVKVAGERWRPQSDTNTMIHRANSNKFGCIVCPLSLCNCDCDQESKSWQTHTRSVPEKQTLKASMRIVIFAHWLASRRKRHRQLTESCSILNSPPLQPVEAFPQLLCPLSANRHWSLKLSPFYTFSLCKWWAA